MTTGICFFIAIFFAPIFASIPPWATGCVLILVGSMMVKSVTEINWNYVGDAVPAFITIVLMPFTYSIADGLIGGICTYMLINTVVWLIELASGGRIVPPNKHEKEPWTWRIPGGFFPPWLVRLTKGKKDFWREEVPAVTETEAVQETPDEKRSGSDKAPSVSGEKKEPVGEMLA
jgi:adenine/guanine/hypoxanthine permease